MSNDQPQKLVSKTYALLAESLRWSSQGAVSMSRIVASALAFLVPIGLGEIFHKAIAGSIMSVAAYLIAIDVLPADRREKVRAVVSEIVGLTLAIGLGSQLTTQTWMMRGLYLFLVFAIALIGGLSRLAARISTLSIIAIIIARNFADAGLPAQLTSGLFFAGGVWIFFLVIVLRPVIDLWLPPPQNELVAAPQGHDPGWRHLLRHWTHSLQHFSGWVYSIRVLLCLSVAELAIAFLSFERSYWVPLTVAIVLQRNPREALKRKIQRTVGTIGGVILACSFLILPLSLFWNLVLVTVLAAFRPILRMRNYGYYSMLMTPLVMLILELHTPVSAGVLYDRMLATCVGCLIGFIFGYLPWRHS